MSSEITLYANRVALPLIEIFETINSISITVTMVFENTEYSCAVTPQIRQTGNRLSGNAGTAYASLLA